MKKLVLFVLLANIGVLFAQKNKSGFEITGGINYGWRTAKISPTLTSEQKKIAEGLTSGTAFDLGIFYMIPSKRKYRSGEIFVYGVGIRYSRYIAGTSGLTIETTSSGETLSVNNNYDDVIYSIGPSFQMVSLNKKKNEFLCEIALGNIGYNQTRGVSAVGYNSGQIKTEGVSLGIYLGYSYLFKLTDSILVGPRINYVSGTLTSVAVTDLLGNTKTIELEGDKKESLSRIDLGITVKIKL